uniref:Uncharacterized protein n=1 Tax=Rhizophora mucronata TaxID=61149 RepID=A0A2P2IPW8_RHIMU
MILSGYWSQNRCSCLDTHIKVCILVSASHTSCMEST